MPVYKGNNEVASGNLYKGSTEIQDGYKATNSFYVNEITVTLPSSVTANGITWSVSTTSFTGAPGSTSSSFTLTASAGGSLNRISGNASVSMNISGVVTQFSESTSNTGGLNNSSTITCSFIFPTNGGSATLSVVGMTKTTYLGSLNLTNNTANNSYFASCNNTSAGICGNPAYGWTGNMGTGTEPQRWNFTGDRPPDANISISVYSSGWTTGSLSSSGIGGIASSSAISSSGGTLNVPTTWDTGPNGATYATISISGYYVTGNTTIQTGTFSNYNIPSFPDCLNCAGNQ